jgi:hypothetical protein
MITTDLLTLANAVLAALIAGSSVCRVNALNPSTHRLGWRIMYVCFGGFAMGAGGFVLTTNPDDEALCILLAGMVGIGMNVLLTHRQWKAGLVPPIANKASHRPASRLDQPVWERRSNGRRKYDDMDFSPSVFGVHK